MLGEERKFSQNPKVLPNNQDVHYGVIIRGFFITVTWFGFYTFMISLTYNGFHYLGTLWLKINKPFVSRVEGYY